MRRAGYIVLGVGVAGLAFFYGGRAMANVFVSRADFVKRLWAAFGRVMPTLGTVQKTILIGQAVHESGWGVAKAAKWGFNYWNLTAGSKWKGPVVHGTDTEYKTPTSSPINITQKFRRYFSDDEAAKDFLAFIGPSSRYSEAWAALLKGDANEYAAKLYAKGFFTQPLPLYQKGLQDGIKTVVQTLG